MRFARALDRNRHRLESIEGLSASELRAFFYVAQAAPITPKEVADHMAITTAAMTYITRRLIDRRLLQRSAHPDDGRSILLELTDHAHIEMQRMHDEFDALMTTAASHLSPEERRNFVSNLVRMADAIHLEIDRLAPDEPTAEP